MPQKRTTKLSLCLLILSIIGFGSAVSANADPVPVGSLVTNGTRTQQGSGFGVVLPVLTLQATPSEMGGVGWNGSADYAFTAQNGTGTGAAVNLGAPHSQTYLFSTLIANGINNAANLGLIYNANETGSALNTVLNNVSLRVYDLAGNWVFQTGLCSGSNPACPGNFPVFNQGQGGDGYLFTLDAAAQAALAAYFANPTQYRVGLWADINNTDDGPEDFYFQAVTPTTPIPEPASMLLLGSGLLGLAQGIRMRRRG